MKKFYIALGILILLTPLGMIAEGAPWGEWEAEELREMIGYIPRGMEEVLGWDAPFLYYAFCDNPFLGYILSAIVGVAAICIVIFGIGRMLHD